MSTIISRVIKKPIWFFKLFFFTAALFQLLACSNGSMSMTSMGLTSDGVDITFPSQGIAKMRKLVSQFKVSGICNSEYNGVEISFDNSTFKSLAVVEDELGPSSELKNNIITYSVSCAQNGSFELNINDLSRFMAKYFPDTAITDPISSDVVFWIRAYNDRSNSKVKSVKITPAPLVLSALYLVSPLTSPGADSTPTVEAADDLVLGDTLTLYYDSECSNPASFTYEFLAGEKLSFDVYTLTDSVTSEFYAKINSGPCSTKLLSYTYKADSLNPIDSLTPTLSSLSFTTANQIRLQWTTVTGAVKYDLNRRILDTNDWTTIKSSSDLTFYLDDSAIGGTTYEYQVIVTVGEGVTRASNIIHQTAIGTIGTPTVSVNKKDITVNWSTVAGANRFKVYWGTASQTYNAYKEISDSTARNYTIPGNSLLDRTRYYIVLKAFNSDGYVRSTEIQATTKFLEVLDSSFGNSGILTLLGNGNHDE